MQRAAGEYCFLLIIKYLGETDPRGPFVIHGGWLAKTLEVSLKLDAQNRPAQTAPEIGMPDGWDVTTKNVKGTVRDLHPFILPVLAQLEELRRYWFNTSVDPHHTDESLWEMTIVLDRGKELIGVLLEVMRNMELTNAGSVAGHAISVGAFADAIVDEIGHRPKIRVEPTTGVLKEVLFQYDLPCDHFPPCTIHFLDVVNL